MMVSEQKLEKLIRESRLVTSETFDQRLLTDAVTRLSQGRQATRPRLSSTEQAQSRRRLLLRLIPPLTILGGLMLVVVWWITRPNDGWAQVVQAVRDKPWIHLTGKSPDGEDIESWLSTTQQVSASREPSYVVFNDFRTGRSEFYSVESQEITRTESDPQSSDRRSFDMFSGLFQELFRGEDKLSIGQEIAKDPDVEKVEQSRQEIRDANGHWYDYHIVFRQKEQQTSTMTIRVDAESMLPQTMTLFESDRGPTGESVTFRFEFPPSGPKDIYALGVPEDAKIVDHTPQPLDNQRKKIVEGIRAAAEGFDDYRAIYILSKPELPWHVGTPLLVWRKGNKMRLEMGCIDPANPPPTDVPDANTDHQAWWKDRYRELWFMPIQVCDGNKFYNPEFATPATDAQPMEPPLTRSPEKWAVTGWKEQSFKLDWPAQTAPIVWVYQQSIEAILASPQFKTKIVSAPTDDALEAIRITSVSTPEGQNRLDEWAYLIDPQKSYAVLESRTSSSTLDDGQKTLQYDTQQTLDQWRQSPKGFWYPSRIRLDSTYPQDGEQKRNITVTSYYLDFDVKLPDSLFEPHERKGETFPE